MKRVYVAGLYSRNADGSVAGVIDVLRNIRNGQKAALDIWRKGFSPFCPWLDYQFSLLDDEPIEIEMYRRYSMDWLEVSDAVVVISGAGIGSGVDAEIKYSEELGIPVFFGMENFMLFLKGGVNDE